MKLFNKISAIFLASFLLTSCAIQQLPDNLTKAFLNQSDVELVKTGMPAYLILMDAAVRTWPDDASYLFAASKLYSSYAFFIDSSQQQRLSEITNQSFEYAQRGLKAFDGSLFELVNGKPDELRKNLDSYGKKYLDPIYAYNTALASWVLANSSDYKALMQMPKIDAMFRWVIKQDKNYSDGMPYIYLGALNSILPPSVGGKPEVGKEFFEQAIKVSKGKNLMARVFYAKTYAKLLFDKELFEKQLNLVLKTDEKAENLTLMNKLAKAEAKDLLRKNKDYFD